MASLVINTALDASGDIYIEYVADNTVQIIPPDNIITATIKIPTTFLYTEMNNDSAIALFNLKSRDWTSSNNVVLQQDMLLSLAKKLDTCIRGTIDCTVYKQLEYLLVNGSDEIIVNGLGNTIVRILQRVFMAHLLSVESTNDNSNLDNIVKLFETALRVKKIFLTNESAMRTFLETRDVANDGNQAAYTGYIGTPGALNTGSTNANLINRLLASVVDVTKATPSGNNKLTYDSLKDAITFFISSTPEGPYRNTVNGTSLFPIKFSSGDSIYFTFDINSSLMGSAPTSSLVSRQPVSSDQKSSLSSSRIFLEFEIGDIEYSQTASSSGEIRLSGMNYSVFSILSDTEKSDFTNALVDDFAKGSGVDRNLITISINTAQGFVIASIAIQEYSDNYVFGYKTVNQTNQMLINAVDTNTINFAQLTTVVTTTGVSPKLPSGLAIWSASISGMAEETSVPLSVVGGNVFTAGRYLSNKICFSDAQSTTKSYLINQSSSSNDQLIARYSATGELKWAYGLGNPSASDGIEGLFSDASSNVYVYGKYTKMIKLYGELNGLYESPTYSLPNVILVASFSPSGELRWTRIMECSGCENVYMYLYESDIYITGNYSNSELKIYDSIGTTVSTSLGRSTENYGNGNVFIAKFKTDGSLTWAMKVGSDVGGSKSQSPGIFVAGSNIYLIVGFFSTPVGTDLYDLNSSVSRRRITSAGYYLINYDTNGIFKWATQVESTNSLTFTICTNFKEKKSEPYIYLYGSDKKLSAYNTTTGSYISYFANINSIEHIRINDTSIYIYYKENETAQDINFMSRTLSRQNAVILSNSSSVTSMQIDEQHVYVVSAFISSTANVTVGYKTIVNPPGSLIASSYMACFSNSSGAFKWSITYRYTIAGSTSYISIPSIVANNSHIFIYVTHNGLSGNSISLYDSSGIVVPNTATITDSATGGFIMCFGSDGILKMKIKAQYITSSFRLFATDMDVGFYTPFSSEHKLYDITGNVVKSLVPYKMYYNAYVAKYNPSGSVQWVRNIGTSFDSKNIMVCTNESGVFITGACSNTPITISGGTIGDVTIPYLSQSDSSMMRMFIGMYDLTGVPKWAAVSSYAKGTDVYKMTSNTSGLFMVGTYAKNISFSNSTNTLTENLTNTNNDTTGYVDLYIVAYNTIGGISWTNGIFTLGANDEVYDIIATTDYVYVFGLSQSGISFTSKGGVATTTMTNTHTKTGFFVACYNMSGVLQYVSTVHDASYNTFYKNMFVKDNAVYVMGINNVEYTPITIMTKLGATQQLSTSIHTINYVFIASLNNVGAANWVTSITGDTNTELKSSSLSVGANLYLTGTYMGSFTLYNVGNADDVSSIILPGRSNDKDIYVASFTASGTVRWARRIGGTSVDLHCTFSTTANEIVLTGKYTSPSLKFYNDMNISVTTLTNSNTNNDSFVAVYDTAGTLQWVRRMGGAKDDIPISHVVDGSSIYLSGTYQSTMDLYDSSGNAIAYKRLEKLETSGNDVFLVKYQI